MVIYIIIFQNFINSFLLSINNMSKIIIFSGIDGSGKSTQIDDLIEKLNKKGNRSFKFWARGGYTPAFLFFKKVTRKLLGEKQIPSGKSIERERILKNKFISTIWITIACFDLILFWGIYLRIKKLFFDFILCDRYLLDTLIDFEINFSQNNFKKNLLWLFLVKLLPIPDLALMRCSGIPKD